jgi:hypothetical protein
VKALFFCEANMTENFRIDNNGCAIVILTTEVLIKECLNGVHRAPQVAGQASQGYLHGVIRDRSGKSENLSRTRGQDI